MKRKLISAQDVETLLKKGGDLKSLPSDALYTPAARDLMRENNGATPSPAPGAAKVAGATDIEKLFHSKEIEALKEQICDIGRRLWERAYVDGNGGNIAIRVSDDLVLCTPTLVSKGFMKPEDLCFVDLEGNQKAGVKKRTSEILTHLAVMKAQPKARATVHCHPPYATAFAVTGVKPPTCMLPEIEVFIGEVPIAEYDTPGTPPVGANIAKHVEHHNTVLMGNHGAISWSDTAEDAYFKMEILEAYCRTVVVATHLGGEMKTFSPAQLKDLLNIKQKLGVPDRRIGLKECELCDNGEWRPGVTCNPPAAGDASEPSTDPEVEAAVQAITDQIMEKLGG